MYYENLKDHYQIQAPLDEHWFPWFVDICTNNREYIRKILKKHNILTRPTYGQINKTPIYFNEQIMKNSKYPKIYNILEKVMLERKNIHPNVDYPCGPTYHLMGIDTDFFTPVFVMARITGWSAHIMEQHTANKLIRPLSKYKGSEHREVLALNIR